MDGNKIYIYIYIYFNNQAGRVGPESNPRLEVNQNMWLELNLSFHSTCLRPEALGRNGWVYAQSRCDHTNTSALNSIIA